MKSVRVIKSPAEHEAALQRLSDLMDQEMRPGSAKEQEFELLSVVIQAYERLLIQDTIPDAVDAIRFRMDQMGLTREDMVQYLGSISRVSEVLSRKRPLSLSMMRRLHAGLGIPAEILLNSLLDKPHAQSKRNTRKPVTDQASAG